MIFIHGIFSNRITICTQKSFVWYFWSKWDICYRDEIYFCKFVFWFFLLLNFRLRNSSKLKTDIFSLIVVVDWCGEMAKGYWGAKVCITSGFKSRDVELHPSYFHNMLPWCHGSPGVNMDEICQGHIETIRKTGELTLVSHMYEIFCLQNIDVNIAKHTPRSLRQTMLCM